MLTQFSDGFKSCFISSSTSMRRITLFCMLDDGCCNGLWMDHVLFFVVKGQWFLYSFYVDWERFLFKGYISSLAWLS